MNTVSTFMARRGSAGAPAGGDATALPSLASTSPIPGDVAKGLRAGTSAISAFSNFAMSFRQASAYDAQARQETLAASAEYTQANEKASAINRAYADTIGAQGVTAAANGLDIGSGTVQAAGRDAETDADRQLQIVRSSADLNARLRQARAAQYRAASSASKATGVLGLFEDVGSLALKAFTGV